MKKDTLVKLCLLVACLGLVSFGNDNPSNNSLKEQQSWFSKEELANIHLQDLPAPTECNGPINISTSWFNDDYSFSKPEKEKPVLINNSTNNDYTNYFFSDNNNYVIKSSNE